MADLLSAIGQGLGAVGGPLVSGGLNLLGGLIQQGGQQSSVQQQESFQEQMSNTAYQRSVADMTKAGLNPAMMYGSGGPESTPMGASMTPPNVMQGVTSSAMDAINTQKQLSVMDSQIKSNSANAAAASAGATKTLAQIPVENLEGNLAKTAQSVLTGIEGFIQRNASNAGPGGGVTGPNGLFQGLLSKADKAENNYAEQDAQGNYLYPVSPAKQFGPAQ